MFNDSSGAKFSWFYVATFHDENLLHRNENHMKTLDFYSQCIVYKYSLLQLKLLSTNTLHY